MSKITEISLDVENHEIEKYDIELKLQMELLSVENMSPVEVRTYLHEGGNILLLYKQVDWYTRTFYHTCILRSGVSDEQISYYEKLTRASVLFGVQWLPINPLPINGR